MKKEKAKKNEKNKLFSFKYFVYDFAKWALGWPSLIWYRVKKLYISKEAKKHNKGGFIISSNHVGMQDPFVIHISFAYRRLHYVLTSEFYKTKFSRWLFNHFLCLKIDRENTGFGALNEMGNELKRGGAVVMFPEGHINLNKDTVDPFKPGIVLLAYRNNAKIQLCYYQKAPHWWKRTKIAIGETIDIKSMCGERPSMDKIKEVANYLHEKEEELRFFYEDKTKKKDKKKNK